MARIYKPLFDPDKLVTADGGKAQLCENCLLIWRPADKTIELRDQYNRSIRFAYYSGSGSDDKVFAKRIASAKDLVARVGLIIRESGLICGVVKPEEMPVGFDPGTVIIRFY